MTVTSGDTPQYDGHDSQHSLISDVACDALPIHCPHSGAGTFLTKASRGPHSRGVDPRQTPNEV